MKTQTLQFFKIESFLPFTENSRKLLETHCSERPLDLSQTLFSWVFSFLQANSVALLLKKVKIKVLIFLYLSCLYVLLLVFLFWRAILGLELLFFYVSVDVLWFYLAWSCSDCDVFCFCVISLVFQWFDCKNSLLG